MNYLPPGSQNQNQLSARYNDRVKGQKWQNDNSENWEYNLRLSKQIYGDNYFCWLLKFFDIQSPDNSRSQYYQIHNYEQEKQQINAIKKELKNPKKLLETFYKVYKIHVEWQKINQENQKKQRRIDELERENQELRESKSSLLSKLSDRDRDTSNTITSDESRPQRDVLTENFIQLKTQEITSVGHEIFNHLSQINSDLKVNRKREIAKIKYVFSQQIFDKGSQCFTGDNSIGEDKFPQVVEDFTTSILTDLQITEAAKFPEPIPTNLKNLVEKGLKLVKEIVNDDPPGHFLIANPGEIFNPENHEPVPSCEPSGQIVYTTYPGYCLNDRIIGESLKAFVFTQPNKQPEGQEEQPFENNQNHQQPNSIEN